MSGIWLPEVDSSVALADEIVEAVELQRQSRTQKHIRFLQWSVRIPEPKTGTLDFERFPFQPEIYEAMGGMNREVVAMKGVQNGMSACTVRAAMYAADIRGENALYVFPSTADVYDFVDDRVEGMVARSTYLRGRMGGDGDFKGVDNKRLKRIGLGNVYFRGSNSKSGLQSAAIDLLVLDEYDDLTPKHIPDAERRISGSLNGRIRRIGVPSYPDYGLHFHWMRSDQRFWLVQCQHCKFIGKPLEGDEKLKHPEGVGWQPISFHVNLDLEARRLVCGGCRKPLEIYKHGLWFPQGTSRIPGFHVSRLMVKATFAEAQDGSMPVDDIVLASKSRDDTEIQTFWNKDLGLPFEPKEGRVTIAALQAAQTIDRGWVQRPFYQGENFVTMGVDVATTRALNVRISEHLMDARNRKRALFIGEVEDIPNGPDAFTQLANMMDLYDVNMAVIDQEPDGRLARALTALFPGRAYICFYSMTAKDSVTVDVEQRQVVVHRTRAMDATRKVLAEQRNILPQDLPQNYVAQMRSPVRKLKKNAMGEMVSFYESRSPDDYYHAETYDVVAREVLVVQLEVSDAAREVYQPLDSMMPFQRSSVNQLEDDNYSSGPNEEYALGPGSGEGFYGPDADPDGW